MVVQDFTSKLVGLDTAPLIYFIEGSSSYQPVLTRLFELNDKGSISFVTSTITLLEVLVRPLREQQSGIASQYRSILAGAPNIELMDITAAIAERAAQLRATYNLRTPDALQLATAVEAGADYFLTNDNQLKALRELAVILVSELR